MSIPKEPRQLMINVMYIVLTALLALNVSAEVFNAFDMVRDGLNKSSAALDVANAKVPQQIKDRAKSKPEYAKYAARVDSVVQLGDDLSAYIDGITEYLIDQTGNRDGVANDGDYRVIKETKELIGKRNFDITTHYLVEKGKGMELHDKIVEYKNKFLSMVEPEDRESVEMALTIDDEAWKHSLTKRENWADFTFNHMPLSATLPIFAKFKNDAKASEAAVLNYLLGKVGGEDVVLDQFTVSSNAKKSYVIKGETFEADVFLTASASAASNTGVSISINGARVPVDENGVAKYKVTTSSVGPKKYNAAVTVTNPVTKEVKTYTNTFEYEVGERSVTVSPTKMNVFYIGVDNPVEVSASGVSSNQLKVSMSGAGGGSIKQNADGSFTVNVKNPTKIGEYANINVEAPGLKATKQFRVKRIPDPIAKLGKLVSGSMNTGSFKAQKGIIPRLDGFDFDTRCNIIEYRLVRAPRRDDPKVALNKGGTYGPEAQRLVDQASPGDRFFFEEVKCKCPGDPVARDINPLTFTIK
jgi:gliding motility-associated protein GldM